MTNQQQAQRLIINEITKALDLLQKHCDNYLTEIAPAFGGNQPATHVPNAYIKQCIKIMKDSYQEALIAEDIAANEALNEDNQP